jgi:CheY-like chemotaxis protein
MSDSFDLSFLLRIGSLEIRSLASENSSLGLKEYFEKLSKFVTNAPPGLDGLRKITANIPIDKADYHNINGLKIFMEDIGCNRYSERFDEIIASCKRGHTKYASDLAKIIREEIKEFFAGVIAAKKAAEKQEEEGKKIPGGTGQPSIPLTTALAQFDQEDSKRKKCVLAVDDSPVMLKTISSILKEEYDVYTLANPMTIEKVLQQITPDLFILDYKMPNRSGFDLVPIIRDFLEHKDTPIIFLTSLGTSEYVSTAFALGACDFIVKPFQDDVLIDKIKRHIVRKK